MQDFDKAFYINLKRRPDRDAEFNSQPVVEELIDHWNLERFEGVDEEPPKEFTLGRGTWGCYQSHLRILELFAATPEWRNVLILEDQFLQSIQDALRAIRLGHDLLRRAAVRKLCLFRQRLLLSMHEHQSNARIRSQSPLP